MYLHQVIPRLLSCVPDFFFPYSHLFDGILYYICFFVSKAPSLPVVLITTFGTAVFNNNLFSRMGYSDLARTVSLNDLDGTI